MVNNVDFGSLLTFYTEPARRVIFTLICFCLFVLLFISFIELTPLIVSWFVYDIT